MLSKGVSGSSTRKPELSFVAVMSGFTTFSILAVSTVLAEFVPTGFSLRYNAPVATALAARTPARMKLRRLK